jgi:hypothetical protein
VHLSVSANLMDNPKHWIFYMISCPVFPATLSIHFSSLFARARVHACNLTKTNKTLTINTQNLRISAGCCWLQEG